MALSARAEAWISLAGHCCDAVGGLYLAYDVFKRHAGFLGVLTRAVTYGVVLAFPAWLLLGPAFGVIAGAGLGALVSLDQHALSRTQHARGGSPLTQPAWHGTLRGVILGVACIPRFGWRFGLATGGFAGALATLVYALGLVPNYHAHGSRLYVPPKSVLRAALLRGAAMGAGTALARMLVPEAGAGMALGAELALLIACASVAVALITPAVEFWTENAGDRFFIYAGLSLLACGLACDTIPHVVVLLER